MDPDSTSDPDSRHRRHEIHRFFVSLPEICGVPVRILDPDLDLSINKQKIKKYFNFYCLYLTSLYSLSSKNDVNVPSKRKKSLEKHGEKKTIFCQRLEGYWHKEQDLEPDPFVKSADPRIRIRTKMPRIRNTEKLRIWDVLFSFHVFAQDYRLYNFFLEFLFYFLDACIT